MPFKGKDAACVVVLKENYVSYPEEVMLSVWKTAFEVVDILAKSFALLEKSTYITMLLGSRIEHAQVLNIPGIRYLIAICI